MRGSIVIMRELKNSVYLMDEFLVIQFDFLLLNKTVECRVCSNSTLNKVLDALKIGLSEDELWYDFASLIVMDPTNKNILHPLKTMQENGCFDGCRLLVI